MELTTLQIDLIKSLAGLTITGLLITGIVYLIVTAVEKISIL